MQGISYIICTHNRPELVKRAVESVIDEAGNIPGVDTELIIVDDNSDIPFCLNKSDFPRYNGSFNIVRTGQTAGVSKARNLGLKNASHSYVLFLDDDDFSLSYRSKVLYPLIKSSDYSFVTGKSVMKTGQHIRVVPGGNPETLDAVLYLRNLPHINSIIWNKEHLLSIGGMDEGLPYFGEHIAALKLLLRGHTALHTPEIVAEFEYRQCGLTFHSHQANLIHSNSVALFTTLLGYSEAEHVFDHTCTRALQMLEIHTVSSLDELFTVLAAV